MVKGLRPRGRRREHRVGSVARPGGWCCARCGGRGRGIARASERHVAWAFVSIRPASVSAGSLGAVGRSWRASVQRGSRQRRAASWSTVPSRVSGGNTASASVLFVESVSVGLSWTHRSRGHGWCRAERQGHRRRGGSPPTCRRSRCAVCPSHAERAIVDGNIYDVLRVYLVQSFVRNTCRHRFSVSLYANPRA